MPIFHKEDNVSGQSDHGWLSHPFTHHRRDHRPAGPFSCFQTVGTGFDLTTIGPGRSHHEKKPCDRDNINSDMFNQWMTVI